MSTKTSSNEMTGSQAKQLISLVDKFSREQVQNLIANGDLVQIMVGCDLAKVDRKAYVDVLVPALTPAADWFTPVDQLPDRIAARPNSEGFSKRQIEQLRRALDGHDHVGDHQPVCVDLWYGSLAATRDATIRWFCDEVLNLGLDPYDYLSEAKLDFYPGSEYTGSRRLGVRRLDLMAYYDPTEGIVPNRILTPDRRWPGFVVLQFLNLNPQFIPKLGTDEFPPYGLMMPGLVAGSDDVPYVSRIRRYASVYYYWADDTWRDTWLPAFGEL